MLFIHGHAGEGYKCLPGCGTGQCAQQKGGFGAVLMNGVKRGLFSNETSSSSAPCAATAADVDHPAKSGLFQAFGVIIDTIVICICTAMIMLLTPGGKLEGLSDMALLQTAMEFHFGRVGVTFIAVTLWLFCFFIFIGILCYAHSNVAYLLGDHWWSQTAYKLLALAMLFSWERFPAGFSRKSPYGSNVGR